MPDELIVIQQAQPNVVKVAQGAPNQITIASSGPQGPAGSAGAAGPTGPPGGTNTYVFHQMSASASWVITHNLGQFPSVTVVDSAGTEVEGTVTFLDNNNIRIDFSAGFAGVAYLN